MTECAKLINLKKNLFGCTIFTACAFDYVPINIHILQDFTLHYIHPYNGQACVSVLLLAPALSSLKQVLPPDGLFWCSVADMFQALNVPSSAREDKKGLNVD